VLVSIGAGVVAIPWGIGTMITYSLSGMCSDTGYCGDQLPLSWVAEREALVTVAWLAGVLLVTCRLPGRAPRRARIAGTFMTAVVFSATAWLPLVASSLGAWANPVVVIVYAAPLVAPLVGAHTAAARRWSDDAL
jgi:hypothetical protein